MSNPATEPRKPNRTVRFVLLALVAVAVVALWKFLPLQDWIMTFQASVRGMGAVGVVLFIIIYALATIALVPGSPITLAAGVAYGLWAFPIVVVAATLGAALSFIAARYVFHDRVQARITRYPKLSAVNEAIREEGWRIVFLLRLSPAFPFSLQNWFLGITPVAFWPAQVATFFGIMPGTLLYIWIADLGATAGSGDTSLYQTLFLGFGLLVTLVVTVLVTRKAAAKLREATGE
jgi:uncharacterized membrane protein YdjX (TVP38/TMEM64 family)